MRPKNTKPALAVRLASAFLATASLASCAAGKITGATQCAQTKSANSANKAPAAHMPNGSMLEAAGGFLDIEELDANDQVVAQRRCTAYLQWVPDLAKRADAADAAAGAADNSTIASLHPKIWTALHCLIDDASAAPVAKFRTRFQISAKDGRYISLDVNLAQLVAANQASASLAQHIADGPELDKVRTRVLRYFMAGASLPEAKCHSDSQTYIIRGESRYIAHGQVSEVSYPYEVTCFDFIESVALESSFATDTLEGENHKLLDQMARQSLKTRAEVTADLTPDKLAETAQWATSSSLFQSHKRLLSWLELGGLLNENQCGGTQFPMLLTSRISDEEMRLICKHRQAVIGTLNSLATAFEPELGTEFKKTFNAVLSAQGQAWSDVRNRSRRTYLIHWESLSRLWRNLTRTPLKQGNATNTKAASNGQEAQPQPDLGGLEALSDVSRALYVHSNFVHSPNAAAGRSRELKPATAPHYVALRLSSLQDFQVSTEFMAGTSSLLYRVHPSNASIRFGHGDSGSLVSLAGVFPLAIVSTLSKPLESLSLATDPLVCSLCTNENYEAVGKAIEGISGGLVLRALPVARPSSASPSSGGSEPGHDTAQKEDQKPTQQASIDSLRGRTVSDSADVTTPNSSLPPEEESAGSPAPSGKRASGTTSAAGCQI